MLFLDTMWYYYIYGIIFLFIYVYVFGMIIEVLKFIYKERNKIGMVDVCVINLYG